ncbi:CASP-like protein 4B4 [Phragmites australis]|uniref:CASP-like protein 4B4 n=1 Tax=Phragmites australis TaxID=29695 RepID=UPI002D78C687|nr:CASP-like protein 4B4 [Phragmites australis]
MARASLYNWWLATREPTDRAPNYRADSIPDPASACQSPAAMAAAGADLEKAAAAPAPVATDGGGAAGAGGVMGAVVRRWRTQDLLDRSGSALRAAAWALSLLAFLVMAFNEHGDWKQFDRYEEYRYIVAIGLLTFIYTTLQLVRHGVRLTGGQDLQAKTGLFVDFAGDQVTAYLMMSALSAAIPITNRMREGADNMFTDSSAVSISMAFFAFVCLALSALISGFKLAKQTYI